jgi:hypothetical protein
MTVWHVLLYSVTAILALRSFIQLVTNYRHEFEQTAAAAEFGPRSEERERQTLVEAERPIAAEAATAA